MKQPTTVLGHLRRQCDQAVTAARRILVDSEERGLSMRATDDLESNLDDAARAAERLDRVIISVGREPMTYREDGPHSLFLDMASLRAGGQEAERAELRLQRHRREMATEMERREVLHRRSFGQAADALGLTREYRDLTRVDTAGGNFVAPLWILEQLGTFPRAGRALADRMTSIPLPAGTDSVSVPRLSTGSAVAIQTADGAAVAETDLVDAAVTAPARTIAGQMDAAMQLVDQAPAPGFDRLAFADLTADYNAKLGAQIISGSAAAGQVSGLLTAPGTAVTYTDASPSVAELVSKVGDLASQVSTARQMVPNVAVVHPRRGFWLMTQPDSQARPMNPVDLAAPERDANAGPVGSLAGLALILDAGIPTSLGAGTNEDRVIVTRTQDHLLLEGDPILTTHVDVLSGTLTVRFSLRRYVAFISHRVPSATGVLSGTGLTAPVFA